MIDIQRYAQGWAVMPKGDKSLCYTSAPLIIGQGTLWQIYKTEEDARKFCEVPFSDAEYEVVQVGISWFDQV